MRAITIQLPRALEERLRRFVARRGRSQSAVVREAIEAYLAAEPERSEGTCFDLASDLAGAVTGPAGLSAKRARLGGTDGERGESGQSKN